MSLFQLYSQPRCPVCRNDFPGNRIFVQRVFPCGERENRDISYVNRRSHSNCESTNKLKTRLKAEESKNKLVFIYFYSHQPIFLLSLSFCGD